MENQNNFHEMVGKNIVTLRQASGYSVMQLAEMLQISRPTLYRWESGEVLPDLINLKKITNLFGVSADWILSEKHDEEVAKKMEETIKRRNAEIVVFSSVNVDVYLENEDNLIMRIDNNTGFNYKYTRVVVAKEFRLIFIGKGFKKTAYVTVDSQGRVEYNLNSILTQEEMINAYDREAALAQLHRKPTGYTFEQLSEVGELEDLVILRKFLNEISSDNYLVALCAQAVSEITMRNKEKLERSFIEAVKAEVLCRYENYAAKRSYGYMIEQALRRLSV